MGSLKKYTATISSWEALVADKLYQLTLQLPVNNPLAFKSGQSIEIQMPTGAYKTFSIANAPRKQGIITCYFREEKDIAALQEYQDSQKKQRDGEEITINFRGPLGTCTYNSFPADKPIILVAGGSANIAPIQALVEQIITENDQRLWHIFWGSSHFSNLLLHSQFRAWEKLLPNLTFTAVVINRNSSDPQAVEQGLVHQVVIRHYPDLKNHFAYISGTSSMIYAAKALYQQHGINPRFVAADILSIQTERSSTKLQLEEA
jgi:CDP-4-dehydro-6-deoxyglucose reductase, E3